MPNYVKIFPRWQTVIKRILQYKTIISLIIEFKTSCTVQYVFKTKQANVKSYNIQANDLANSLKIYRSQYSLKHFVLKVALLAEQKPIW